MDGTEPTDVSARNIGAQEADLKAREATTIENLGRKLREIIAELMLGRLEQRELDSRIDDIKRDLELLRGKHAPAPFDFVRTAREPD